MNVIPKPVSLNINQGFYTLSPNFAVRSQSKTLRNYLIDEVHKKYGLTAKEGSPASVTLRLEDNMQVLDSFKFREEGYCLKVTSTGINITAETNNGLFYGIQTFLQLLPFSLKQDPKEADIALLEIVDAPRFKWRGVLLDVGRHFFEVSFIKRFLDHLAMYKINRFHWHLTEDQGWRIEIKQFSRLTEIGSWRKTKFNGKYGGFYTQDEIKDIVAYAKERFIEVMPEIEMPGHCGASLAAYPHLCCAEDVIETPSEWGIYEDVYCAVSTANLADCSQILHQGKDSVLDFLKRVLDEVIDLFPFGYIHIGGDEAPRSRWRDCYKCQDRIEKQNLRGEDELQSWFISQIAEYLLKKDRKIVGWDEILDGGLPSGATVMSWRGIVGGYVAAKLGHDVIMSPAGNCYFDYKQSASQEEPGAYYATLPLENVYAFEPIPDPVLLSRVDSPDSTQQSSHMEVSEVSESGCGMELDESQSKNAASSNGENFDSFSDLRPEQQLIEDIRQGRHLEKLTASEEDHILGGQANVWTEYISDEEVCEYMLLPRLCAFSETVWYAQSPSDSHTVSSRSDKGSRDFRGFNKRLVEHVKLFDLLELRFRSLDD